MFDGSALTNEAHIDTVLQFAASSAPLIRGALAKDFAHGARLRKLFRESFPAAAGGGVQ
jgi:hypothetical protein